MHKVRRGDTIIEVIIAIMIFCLVSIISITLMNSGINTAEGSLELVMTRNEIDAQAEAIRFIHGNFLAERELVGDQQQFGGLWRRITSLAIDASNLPDFSLSTCDEAYKEPGNIYSTNAGAFVVNTRHIDPTDTGNVNDSGGSTVYGRIPDTEIIVSARAAPQAFAATELYPRIVFSNRGYTVGQDTSDDNISSASDAFTFIARAEGIWVIAVKSDSKINDRTEFFDFYIRSCWYKPGQSVPSTIGTIVRLYNPEII